MSVELTGPDSDFSGLTLGDGSGEMSFERIWKDTLEIEVELPSDYHMGGTVRRSFTLTRDQADAIMTFWTSEMNP